MAKLPSKIKPAKKKITEVGTILAVECTAECPECKELSTTQIRVEIEQDYSGCWYEGDSPSSVLQGTFECGRCETTFIASTKGYIL